MSRRGIMTLLTIVALGAAGWWAVPGTAAPEAQRVPQATNPHWKADGCIACHDQDAPTQPIALEKADAICLDCHDGQRAPEEVHPIGRRFDGKEVVLPDGWPAPGGKLGCVTCHDVVQACNRNVRRPAFNPAMLRDYAGPNVLDHCARCHVAAARTQGQRYNPHRMFDEQGRLQTQACAFCHTSEMDFSAAQRQFDRTGLPFLRTDGISMCVGCHRTHQDYFEPGHIGLRVEPEFAASMRERQPPLTHGHTPATQPTRSGADLLPLADGGRVVCSTCHNPHPQGLFPSSSVLASGGMPPWERSPSGTNATTAQRKLQLRGLGTHVCLGCHDQ